MLSLVFGKTTPIYHPGEHLTGDVVFDAIGPGYILDLTVNFCGMSEVSFLVGEGTGESHTCEKVEETAFHLDVLHALVRSYRGVFVEAGVHTYPFRLKLPEVLPSSFHSPYGNIDHFIHIHLNTSAGTLDLRKPFVIVAPVNINLFTTCHNPQSAVTVKKYGLVNSTTLRLKASVKKTAFVAGDVIPVFIEVSNETSQRLSYLFCTLKQVTTVQVQLPEKTVERVTKQCLVTIAHKLESESHLAWLCSLPAPTFLTPTLSSSTTVFVTYCIQVSLKIKQNPIPLEVKIPVVFGVRGPSPGEARIVNPHPTLRNRSRHISFQAQTSIENCSEENQSLLAPVAEGPTRPNSTQTTPTATNPRRRVTVSCQPQLSPTNPSRRISQWQSVAANLSQLQTTIASSIERLSLAKM